MDIATGQAQGQPPNPLPLNTAATPGVAAVTARDPSGTEQAAARDVAGERLSQLAASEAECQAAQSYGQSADSDRRAFFEGDIKPLASEYGITMDLPGVTSDFSKHTGSPGLPASGPAG